MTSDGGHLRDPSRVYSTAAVEWQIRLLGSHIHPGAEDATVALASAAEHYGFPQGGRIVDIASALGGPARYLARRFAATVLCVDMSLEMQANLARGAEAAGLSRRCVPILARIEALPLVTSSCDAAWSQDAMCHMDKAAVMREVARVLRPGGVFAFSDFIAYTSLTGDDAEMLAREWGFSSLLRLSEYVSLLAANSFEVMLAEDHTQAIMSKQSRATPCDDIAWARDFDARWGERENERQRSLAFRWVNLVLAGRAGYGRFVAKRL